MKRLADCKVLVTATSYASQDERLRTTLEEKVGEVVYNTTGKPLSSPQLQELLPAVDGMILVLGNFFRRVAALNISTAVPSFVADRRIHHHLVFLGAVCTAELIP